MLVYLAGGMRNPWRKEVMRRLPQLSYLDPSTHGLQDEFDYTMWDLNAIRECDLVFAYLESTNPSGAGLANEIGFAYANEKLILFVDCANEPIKRYFGMCRAEADWVFNSLEEGIDYLAKRVGVVSI